MTTDRHGWEIGEYPDQHGEYGRLLGITLFGNAAYATPERVRLAERTAAGPLRASPRQHWTGHDFPLGDVEMSVGEYLRGIADDYGPWRAPSAFGREQAASANVDTESVIRESLDPPQRDAAPLVDAVADGDWGSRSDASGALRMLAMDDPESVAPRVADLVPILDDMRGERERIDTEADEPEGNQPFDERTSNTARMTVRRDVAYVVARVGRADRLRSRRAFGASSASQATAPTTTRRRRTSGISSTSSTTWGDATRRRSPRSWRRRSRRTTSRFADGH
jgi:hypothetical protein